MATLNPHYGPAQSSEVILIDNNNNNNSNKEDRLDSNNNNTNNHIDEQPNGESDIVVGVITSMTKLVNQSEVSWYYIQFFCEI